MPSYTGYQGYGDPERAKVDRARQMAELLQQGATDTSPKSFWEGAAQLGKAFIARGAMDKADQAEATDAKYQARLLNHLMDPNTDESGFSPSQMQPTINVGTEPETVVNWKDQPPAAATPASDAQADRIRALANFFGDGRPADKNAKQVSLPPVQPSATAATPAAATGASHMQSSVSPEIEKITAALMPPAAPQPVQSGAPPMTPAPQTAAPPTMAQAPPPAAPNRQAALQTMMRYTNGDLPAAMALVEAKYGAAPQGMNAYEAEQIRLKELEMKAGPKPQIYSTSQGLVEAAPGQEPKLVYGTEDDKPPWTGAIKGPDGNWVYSPEYIKGEQAMRASSAGGAAKPPSGYTFTPDGTLAAIPGGPADKRPGEMPLDLIRAEMSLADDWSKIQRDFDEVNSQAERAKALGGLANQSVESQSAADLALIVTATKILDPTSVAREGEVKLTQSSASIWQQVQNLPNQWQYGQTTLPKAQRQALLQMIESLMPSYRQAYEKRAADMKSSAQAYGFGEQRVMPGYRPSPAQVEQARRAQNAGAILGGTGEFNPAAFANMRQPSAADMGDDELRAMLGLE